MDYKLLKRKVNYIVDGLQCANDAQATDEFLRLLDDFAQRQIRKMEFEIANEKLQRN